MINSSRKLAGKTLFITGASRGIGKAIALKAASDGANIVIAAKTADPHPKLPGTIYSAAEEVEKAGGKALPCIVDVRDETQVKNAIKAAVEKFGGIDILINNASAISLTSTQNTDMKRYDLMNSINTRGTFLLSKECLPFLLKSNHAHILNISPPLNMTPKWFSNHVAYTIAKYGMSMCALGMALEFKDKKIAVNALWPRTAIHTAAIEMLTGPESSKWSRKPEIMADAAYAILCRTPDVCTGNFFIDETVLQEEGVKNFTNYACDPAYADKLMTDFFLDAEETSEEKVENVTHSSQKEEGVNKIFASITKLLNEDLVKKVNSVYQFNLHGEQKGVWFVDLKTGAGTCGKGEAVTKPDAVLSMDSRNFFEMFTGKLKPANAFLSGKLKISGDLQKAMKLEKLMVGLKSKM